MGSIISILQGVVSLFNKLTDFFAKKDMENQIKNSYEKDKQISVLKENEKVRETIENSVKQVEEAKETIKNISNVKEEDASLSDAQIETELAGIIDPIDRKDREEQIKLAKDIKERASKKQADLEKNAKFNSGEDFTFKG